MRRRPQLQRRQTDGVAKLDYVAAVGGSKLVAVVVLREVAVAGEN